MSYTSIKIEPLHRNNFDTWKIQSQALLARNELWQYVSGACTKPTEAAAAAEWKNNDAKAKADLILAISPSDPQHIKNCATSKDLFIYLFYLFILINYKTCVYQLIH